MGSAVLAARVFLAGVFIVAGVGKLLDLAGSRKALVGFGVSESFAGVAGTALPLVELATAVALLIRATATVGAVVALVLLVAFVVGITRAMSRGEEPDCHCFGTIHSAPAGRTQVVRNVGLGAVAVFALASGPGSTVNGWISARGASEVVIVLLAVATLGLLALSLVLWRERQHLRLSLSGARRVVSSMPPGLPVGALAPDFSARDLTGETFTLSELRSRRRPVALVFGAPGCGPCSALAPELPRWREAFAGELTIGVVGVGTFVRYQAAAELSGASLHDLYEREPELARENDGLDVILASYRLKATPAAVIVTPEGTIASATVNGRPAIEALLRLAVTRRGGVGLAADRAVIA
ncbi:MAG: MauE/DoxX family redox-associated membrane protein [Solirubrobacteraceae bacterium]